MRVVGAMSPNGIAMGLSGFEQVELKSGAVACGMLEMEDNVLDRNRPGSAKQALLRVRSFSCNYRDRGLIRHGVQTAPANTLVPFGSEFCGEILDIGTEVRNVAIGDRVFGLFAYPEPPEPGIPPGLASNRCSQEFLPIVAAKLTRVPKGMTDAEAAAFSLNGLTVAGMIRRLELKADEKLLLLAGRSNVALFAGQAAAAIGADVTAVTTSAELAERLREFGAERVVIMRDPRAGLAGCKELAQIARWGFDAVIDPFMDAHLHQAPEIMGVGGRYITCGSARQTVGDAIAHAVSPDWMQRHFYRHLLAKNIKLMGNCLGESRDLERALEWWREGSLKPVIDSCYDATEAAAFLRRTFADPNRLGKVVCVFP